MTPVIVVVLTAMAGDAGLTLAECLDYAATHAPALDVARAAQGRGDAERVAAEPWLPENPALALTGGARFGGGQDGADVGAAIAQRLEVAGEQWLRRDAASARAATFARERARAEADLRRAVRLAFFDALLAAEAERAAADLVRSAQESLAVAEKRAQSGDAAPFVMKLARADLARAQDAEIGAVEHHTRARIALALVIGADDTEVRARGALPAVSAAPALAELVEVARTLQPELRRAHSEVEAARARGALADREAFPKPVVGVSYDAEGVGSNATQHIVLGTVEVALPVWQRNGGERARASAEAAVAEAEERALARTLEKRIALAKARVDASAARIAIYASDIVPPAEENLRLMHDAFALGDVDVTAVTTARDKLGATRATMLDVRRAYFVALHDLEVEVGADVAR